jgi:hypothetical protein
LYFIKNNYLLFDKIEAVGYNGDSKSAAGGYGGDSK